MTFIIAFSKIDLEAKHCPVYLQFCFFLGINRSVCFIHCVGKDFSSPSQTSSPVWRNVVPSLSAMFVFSYFLADVAFPPFLFFILLLLCLLCFPELQWFTCLRIRTIFIEVQDFLHQLGETQSDAGDSPLVCLWGYLQWFFYSKESHWGHVQLHLVGGCRLRVNKRENDWTQHLPLLMDCGSMRAVASSCHHPAFPSWCTVLSNCEPNKQQASSDNFTHHFSLTRRKEKWKG